LLALLDSWAPIGPNLQLLDVSDETVLLGFAMDLGGRSEKHLLLADDELQQLGPDEQLHSIIQRARAIDLLPPDVDVARLRHLFRVYQANFQAVKSYQPQVYPDRITLLCAGEGGAAEQEIPTRGWDQLTTAPLTTDVVPGDHYTVLRHPHVQVLAERLGRYLAAAQREQTRVLDDPRIAGLSPEKRKLLELLLKQEEQ